MEDKPLVINEDGYRCEEQCALEWADCVENEDDTVTCKTYERNCFDDCQW